MSNDNRQNIESANLFDWKIESPEFKFTPVDKLLIGHQQLTAPTVEGMTALAVKHRSNLQDSVVELFEDIDSGTNPFKGYSEDDTVAAFGVVEAHLRTNLDADDTKVKQLTDTMLRSMKNSPDSNKTDAPAENQVNETTVISEQPKAFIKPLKPAEAAVLKLRTQSKALLGLIRLEDSVNIQTAIKSERRQRTVKALAVAAGVIAFFTLNGRSSTNDTTSEKVASAEYIMPNSLPAPFETTTTLQITPIEVAVSSTVPQNSTDITVTPEETAQPVVRSLPPVPTTTAPVAKITPEEVSTTSQSLIAIQAGDGFERLFRREYGLSNEQAARLSNLLFVELSSLPGTYLDKASNSVRIGNVDYLDFSSINAQVMTLVTQIRLEA